MLAIRGFKGGLEGRALVVRVKGVGGAGFLEFQGFHHHDLAEMCVRRPRQGK